MTARARLIAIPTVAGLCAALALPAFAQTTQTTTPTTTTTTPTTTPTTNVPTKADARCNNSVAGTTTSGTGGSGTAATQPNSTTTTNGTTTTTTSTNGTTTTTNTTTTGAAGVNVNCPPGAANPVPPAVAPPSNYNPNGAMQNMNALTNNPNGANWLAKFDRPAVIQQNAHAGLMGTGTMRNRLYRTMRRCKPATGSTASNAKICP
jgi:hypothetical protein